MTVIEGGFAPGFLYVSSPRNAPPPEVDPGRRGYSIWIEPEDPELPTWGLTNGYEDGVILLRGIRGLGSPDHVEFVDEYAAIDGEYYFGERTAPREIFLPIHLFHDGTSLEWVEHSRTFWKMFRRGQHVRIYVQAPDAEVFSIRARYQKGGEEASILDPAFYGWASHGIYLKASQPFWEGAEVRQEWKQQELLPMFGASHPGPPFNIAYRRLDSATITNRGDVDAWPLVTLEGPMDAGAEVTIGGGTVSVPFELDEGDVLVMDYSPREQSAILNGVTDKTKDLGSYGWRRLPPGKNVAVGIEIPGVTGGLAVAFTPLMERVI
jgi:hypothetical protein